MKRGGQLTISMYPHPVSPQKDWILTKQGATFISRDKRIPAYPYPAASLFFIKYPIIVALFQIALVNNKFMVNKLVLKIIINDYVAAST